jgi:predicted MFS family arabinose efflux permease
METSENARFKKAVYVSSIPYFVCGFTDFLIVTHLVAYATSFKVGLTPASLSLSLIGAFNIPALVLLGLFADRFGAAASLTLTYATRLGSFIILLNADTLPKIYLFAAIFGLTYYTTAPLAAKLVFTGYRSTQASTVYGILVLIHMIGGALGALFGGAIYDAYSTYQPAFLFSTLLLASAVLLSFYAQKVSSP